MRKLTVPFAVAGLMAWGALGCEVNEGAPTSDTTQQTDTQGDTTTADTTETDTTEPDPEYYAVFLDDLWDGRCATSGYGAHGADIDAVGLFEGESHIAWLDADFIDAEFTPSCPSHDKSQDPKRAAGAPDGNVGSGTGFYSLAGGWLIGEFVGAPLIIPGYELVVYEVDSSYTWSGGAGRNDPYEVYVATSIDCVNEGPGFRNSCMVRLTGSQGANGSATIPVVGF